MVKNNTAKTIASGPAPKAKSKTVKKKIEDAVDNIVEEVKEEANEEIGTVTFKRWQIVAAAVAVTAVLLFIIL